MGGAMAARSRRFELGRPRRLLGRLIPTLSEARRRVPRPGSPVGGCGSAARMGGAGVIRGLTVVSRWARRWRYISARGLGQA